MNSSFGRLTVLGSLMVAGTLLDGVYGCSGKTDAAPSTSPGALDGSTPTDGATDGATSPVDSAFPIGDGAACVPIAACVTSSCPTNTDAGLVGCDWNCPLPMLCAPVGFSRPDTSSSGGAGIDASWSVNDVTAARCAIAALRDGTPGRIDWGAGVTGALGGGTQQTVYLVGNRQAYDGYNETGDSFSSGRTAGEALQPSSYFEACLDGGTPDTYEQCLSAALLPCQ